MPKGQFWDDTFEKVVEMGQSTAKKSAQQVVQTFSPLKILENALGQNSDMQSGKEKNAQLNKEQKNTPLDLKKLQEKYNNQDKVKTDTLRNHLFQLVKRGEEKVLDDEKRKEQEKKRQEAYEEHEKKRQLAQKKQIEAVQETPHGKQRRSIFSPKKAAKREQVEVKPASGKQ